MNSPILFIDVPDAKQVRNRLHFDLRPTERSRDAERDHVLTLGATELEDRRTEDGRGWRLEGRRRALR